MNPIPQFNDGSEHGASPSPPLSIPELTDRCMGNAGLAVLLLEKFETQIQNDIGEIERRLAAGDATQIRGTAHALKGAAGAVAAVALREAAAAIEKLARENRLDSITQELRSLQGEVQRCLAYMPRAREALAAGVSGASAEVEGGR